VALGTYDQKTVKTGIPLKPRSWADCTRSRSRMAGGSKRWRWLRFYVL